MRGVKLGKRTDKLRLYLDENFPAPSGKFLRSLGHNILQVIDQKSSISLSDLSQIRKANKDKRILVALDKDFLFNKSLHTLISKGPGVILLKSSDTNYKKLNEIMMKLLKKINHEIIQGMICIASIEKIELIDPLEII